MNKFIYNIILFFIPIILLVVAFIQLDPFKVLNEYESYYEDNLVALNREFVCLKTYNKYREQEKFNSFIFGSSRSQAYKCEQWKKYLAPADNQFHFDAGGEGVYGVRNKVKYIDSIGDKIENALIIVDREFLVRTKNRSGHIFISPPEFTKTSKTAYYMVFINASLNLRFMIAYLDYKMFGSYRPYMADLIIKPNYKARANDVNCDFWYNRDEHIQKDSLGYYKQLIDQGVFYDRASNKKRDMCDVTELERKQLKEIKEVFSHHNTNYKIIISPLYDQIPLEKDQVELLEEIFGAQNVYNFSGKNDLTEPIINYYEASHYKPFVANMILSKIYREEN